MSEVREGDTIKTDNTIAAALLTVKLREANALIDTLVEAGNRFIAAHEEGLRKLVSIMGESGKLTLDIHPEQADAIKEQCAAIDNLTQALAEAKKQER